MRFKLAASALAVVALGLAWPANSSASHVPTLHARDTKFYAMKAMALKFGPPAHNGTAVYRRCTHRLSRTRMQCDGVAWFHARSIYVGWVTIFLFSDQGQVYWSSHYRINKVNFHCYQHTGHIAGCTRHVYRR